MNLSKKKSYLIAAIISLILFIGISFIGAYSFKYKIIVGSSAYFLISFLLLKYFKILNTSYVLWLILLPITLSFLYLNIFQFKNTFVSAPSNFFLILGCITGYLFNKKKSILIPALFFTLLPVWLIFLQPFYNNKMLYGTYNKVVKFKRPLVTFYDTISQEIVFNEKKTILLDFWNSRCRPCYELFPYIDSVNKTIDTSKIKIYAVNIPLDIEKMEDNFRLLDEKGYSFTKIFAKNEKVLDSLKIKFFPTTIIIQDGNVIYKGDFETAIQKVKQNNH